MYIYIYKYIYIYVCICTGTVTIGPEPDVFWFQNGVSINDDPLVSQKTVTAEEFSVADGDITCEVHAKPAFVCPPTGFMCDCVGEASIVQSYTDPTTVKTKTEHYVMNSTAPFDCVLASFAGA